MEIKTGYRKSILIGYVGKITFHHRLVNVKILVIDKASSLELSFKVTVLEKLSV